MFDEMNVDGKKMEMVNLINSNEDYEVYGQLESQFLTDAPMTVIDEIIESVINITDDVFKRVNMIESIIEERGYVVKSVKFHEREIGDV